MTNEEVARSLAEVADLLEEQGANEFRVRAYRSAVEMIAGLQRPLEQIYENQGRPGLEKLPRIGRSLAGAIEQLLRTGRLPLLDRLRGEHEPERIFATVANIGPELARRIHEALDIDTLAELEVAAHDGRLATVPGMGAKRVRSVQESLAGRFRMRPGPTGGRGMTRPPEPTVEPPVAELLDVDSEYRRLAGRGRLPRIAPRRFNPTRQAWLPILHTERDGRHYTALYSNTARAHELGTTRDWVVIYLDDRDQQGQWTVITSGLGDLRGRRIVRGREPECKAYYDKRELL